MTPRRPASPGFTLVELLVVIAIIGALAGILVPSIMAARERAKRMQCTNNVREIGRLSAVYSDDSNGWFPHGGGDRPPAYVSFQKLVDHSHRSLPPEMFLCPESREVAAAPMTPGGHYTLGPENNSYATIARRTSNTDSGQLPLVADDAPRHNGGSCVAVVGSSAVYWDRGKLNGRTIPEGLVDDEGRTGDLE